MKTTIRIAPLDAALVLRGDGTFRSLAAAHPQRPAAQGERDERAGVRGSRQADHDDRQGRDACCGLRVPRSSAVLDPRGRALRSAVNLVHAPRGPTRSPCAVAMTDCFELKLHLTGPCQIAREGVRRLACEANLPSLESAVSSRARGPSECGLAQAQEPRPWSHFSSARSISISTGIASRTPAKRPACDIRCHAFSW